jgi:hypothetical protein
MASTAEPAPRIVPLPYKPFQWTEGAVQLLDAPLPSQTYDLVTVLAGRRTRREFEVPAVGQLSDLFGLACRTVATRPSPFGFDQELRAHPSAGAVHPMHVLCQRGPGGPWERYDPVRHALAELVGSAQLAAQARMQANSAAPSGAAALVALVAEPGKTQSKYENHESLVWRDGGVLLGVMAVTAEALGLNLCPLGISGHEFVAPLAVEGTLLGVGLVVVGARPEQARTAALEPPR